MTEENIHAPTIGELPSRRQLNRATAIAAAIAAVLLVTVVLPAEFGVDPTRVGNLLGLTEMGAMKRAQIAAASISQAPEVIIDQRPPAKSGLRTVPIANRSAELRVSLRPDEGVELKATLASGAQLNYSWSTGGPAVNFELHGERTGAPKGEYTSYKKGTANGANGGFAAPFSGTHGWFLRNRTDSDLTIIMRIDGQYEKLVQKNQGRSAKGFSLRALLKRIFGV